MFNKIKRYSLLSAMFVSIMLVANDASAQTLGEMFDGIRANINIMSALSVMSWIMGAFLTALGIRKISQHADAPQQIQIQEPVKYLIAGGMFLSIPSIAGVVQRGFGDGGGYDRCLGIFNNSRNSIHCSWVLCSSRCCRGDTREHDDGWFITCVCRCNPCEFWSIRKYNTKYIGN